VTQKMLNLNGFDLNIFDDGDGDAVMLLHGFPDSLKLWRKQIPPVPTNQKLCLPSLVSVMDTAKLQNYSTNTTLKISTNM
jgi:pimeloyl-ACP methyl ester carboxylesterase